MHRTEGNSYLVSRLTSRLISRLISLLSRSRSAVSLHLGSSRWSAAVGHHDLYTRHQMDRSNGILHNRHYFHPARSMGLPRDTSTRKVLERRGAPQEIQSRVTYVRSFRVRQTGAFPSLVEVVTSSFDPKRSTYTPVGAYCSRETWSGVQAAAEEDDP